MNKNDISSNLGKIDTNKNNISNNLEKIDTNKNGYVHFCLQSILPRVI